MFGCYRRGDANDPDTYVAAVTMVLSRYSADIVKTVTDPCSGLPGRKSESGWSGLPDVADVKEACEAEAARLASIARYAAWPKAAPRLPKPPAGPGAFANVKVPREFSRYAALWARTQQEGADRREWKVENGELYVALGWIEEPQKMPAQRFTAPTDELLRELYPPKPAAEQGEEAA